MEERRYERSPMCEALFRRDTDMIRLLLGAGAAVTRNEMDILWENFRGYSGGESIPPNILYELGGCSVKQKELLLMAILNGDDSLADEWLDEVGPGMHIPPRILSTIEGDFEVCTPLQAALLRRSSASVKRMWNKGCRFSRLVQHSKGSYELELACVAFNIDYGMSEVIESFMRNGASPNRLARARASEDAIPADTALHAVIRSALYKDNSWWDEAKILEVCKMLVAHGASANQMAMSKLDVDYSDWGAVAYTPLVGTPVQMACEYGLLSLVKYLTSQDPRSILAPAWHEGGRTALQAACYSRKPSVELVEYLISNHVSVNEEPAKTDGVTALQAAAIRGRVDIALMLLDAGADVDAPATGDSGAITAIIDCAAEHGRLDMVKLLINAGASGDKANPRQFHSAIKLAEEQGHYLVAALLEEQ